MTNTANLNLPYILPSQAQKHLTHNEALVKLDILVQARVLDRDLTTPPGTPVEGDCYIPATTATGDWTAHEDKLAVWHSGEWVFHEAKSGWFVFAVDEGKLLLFDGSIWGDFGEAIGALQNYSQLGVNTTADATNKLAVSSDAVLFNHAGNGVQTKLNKNVAGDTASLLFQTNWSGRAEMGTTGDDDFHFKVSPDGSTWFEGLTIDKDDGAVNISKFNSTGITDNATSTAITINASKKVGIGTTAPDGTTHVFSGSAGTFTPSSTYDDVVVENSSNAGITVVSPDANVAGLILTGISGNSNQGSSIVWSQSADELSIRTNETAGKILIKTGSLAECARFTSQGYIKITNNGTYIGSTGAYHEFNQAANSEAVILSSGHASLSRTTFEMRATRAASSSYSLFSGYSSGGGDLEFRLYGDGNGKCDGAWTGGGADYAEFFEWEDGNPNKEDRRGVSVVLVGDKIRPAKKGERPIGVISGNPSVVGDAAWNKWSGKYLRDDFGTYVQEDYEVVEWTATEKYEIEPATKAVGKVIGKSGRVIEPAVKAKGAVRGSRQLNRSFSADEVPDGIKVPRGAKRTIQQRRKLNPAYDPAKAKDYIPREDRPEWDAVGLMGKLRIRKGQPVNDRWVKMRAVSTRIDEWLIGI